MAEGAIHGAAHGVATGYRGGKGDWKDMLAGAGIGGLVGGAIGAGMGYYKYLHFVKGEPRYVVLDTKNQGSTIRVRVTKNIPIGGGTVKAHFPLTKFFFVTIETTPSSVTPGILGSSGVFAWHNEDTIDYLKNREYNYEKKWNLNF